MSVLYLKIWSLLNIDFISLSSKSIADLPRIYVNNPALLPKSKGRKYVVSITKVLAYKKYFLLKLNSFRSFIYKKTKDDLELERKNHTILNSCEVRE